MAGAATPTRMKRMRTMAANALILCLLGLLMAAGFANAGAIEMLYPSLSLRYDKPISGQAAYAARLYSVEHGDEEAFWPTFWREDKASFSSEYATVTTDCITYSGDIALVWPAEYLSGTAPGVTDGNGCAVSSALAWKLWGSTDAVGKTVEADGRKRIVRAVFDGDTALALLPYSDDDTTQSWSAVELSGGPIDSSREDAEAYAIVSGLGKPDSILTGAAVSFLAASMATLPVVIMAGYGIALTTGLIHTYPAARKLIPFLLLLGFVLLLPGLLELVPSWLIPSRWSDFSFWSSKAQEMYNRFREFLSTTPRQRDIDGQMRMLLQMSIAAVSACWALLLCFRWHIMRLRQQHAVK